MRATLLNTVSAVAWHVAMPLHRHGETRAFYAPFSPRWFRCAVAEEPSTAEAGA